MGKGMSWQQEIDFQCSFGMWPFRRTLEISPNGFCWCGENFPLKSITRLRWGVDQKRGGILPKRVCMATFGTEKREFTIKTQQKDFYEHLTDRYWKAVGRRLLSEMLEGLASGKKYEFGREAEVNDEGLFKKGRAVFGSAGDLYYPWEELQWGIVNGCLCFAPKNDAAKLIAGLSFLSVDNVHVLNVALAVLSNSENKKKLSECER
ncbi:MAG: hypothetical protein RR214_05860 [Synergistaceae bacterium]